MTAALISVNAGVGTVYSSGDLSALAHVSALSELIITRTANTPAGDPVVVDFTSGLAGVSALSSITVQNGATLVDEGGLANVSALSAVNIDGGTYEATSDLLNVNALKSITVGPAGGVLKIDQPGLASVTLNLPVSFVDANGNATSTVPDNFVLDMPYETYTVPLVGTYNVPIAVTYSDGYTVVQDQTGPLTQLLSRLGVSLLTRTVTIDGNPFGLTDGESVTYESGTDAIICFLPGSMIRTPKGDVAVENLVAGQEVLAFAADGQPVARRITWAGKAHARTNPDLADDVAGYPVRVRANAIADGVPAADLLITPEHCLYLQGSFVPARMLVNGTSIVYDKSFAGYDYYHIETEGHAVIMANGMLTESYLDTGNRASFTQAGPVARIGGAVKSWAQDAAAKLETSRTFVEPLFRTLAERGSTLYANTTAQQAAHTSAQPNLHLVTAQGHSVHPLRHENGIYTFMLPAQAAENVYLASRTFRPCDAEGPFVDDRRTLGVAVGQVSITSAGTHQPVTAHLSTDALQGWHAAEISGHARWTNGHAKLPLPATLQGLCLLHVQVLATGAYTVPAHTAQAQAALA
ncbi:Hint domain-containing protein [Acetobacter pasteurianus]|uniref:Hint domain-containing protein n=1 Tax=Acetobacter pasteurianus TaxID=438 RepID=UPI003D12CD45